MVLIKKTENQIIIEEEIIKTLLFLHRNLLNLVGVLLAAAIMIIGSVFGFDGILVFVVAILSILVLITAYQYIKVGGIHFSHKHVFDLSSNTVTRVTTVLSFLLEKEFNLDSLSSISFAQANSSNKISIRRINNKPYQILLSRFEDAEILSQFLNLPLQYQIGFENIVRFPKILRYRDVTATSMNCPRCGGQLPTISPEIDQVFCDYCKTYTRLDWIQ